MSLADVLTGIEGRLGSITGLRVHRSMPERVNELPAVAVAGVDGEYGRSYAASGAAWTLRLTLLVHGWDAPEAMERLSAFLEGTGKSSVRAALDGDLDGAADYARVVRVEQVGRRRVAGGVYAAADFIVVVREAGA